MLKRLMILVAIALFAASLGCPKRQTAVPTEDAASEDASEPAPPAEDAGPLTVDGFQTVED